MLVDFGGTDGADGREGCEFPNGVGDAEAFLGTDFLAVPDFEGDRFVFGRPGGTGRPGARTGDEGAPETAPSGFVNPDLQDVVVFESEGEHPICLTCSLVSSSIKF